ncbi:hypothetical protein AB0I60_29280 [Actinosynnema sp. NPDC050436]|uniref:hypothetical protein n=1 Tax=Actinosynnema sp. NPDC050436 TaxID=3155659 RepID=UPI0033EBA931
MKRVAVVVAGGVLAAALLAWVTGLGAWPAWVGVLLTSVVFLVVLAVVWSARPAPQVVVVPEPEPAPPPPPPAPPRPVLPITEVRVPSSDDDYRFLLSGVVCWRIRSNPSRPLTADPADLAKREVVARTCQITADGRPDEYDLVQHRVDSALAAPMPDRTGAIDVWAHSVLLTLAPDDLRRQAELATVRKDEQVWEHSRRYHRNVQQYLRSEVLGDTGSGVTWYLAMNPERIEETVDKIGTFAQLSAAANNREVDEVFRHLVYEPVAPPPVLLPGSSPVDGVPALSGGIGNGFHDTAYGVPLTTAVTGTSDNADGQDDEAVDGARKLVSSLFGGADADAQRSHFASRMAWLIEHHGDSDLARRLRDAFDVPDLTEPPDPDVVDDADEDDPFTVPDRVGEPAPEPQANGNPAPAEQPTPEQPPRHAYDPFRSQADQDD